MAVAVSAEVWRAALVSRTVRQYQRAVMMALAVLALGGLFYLLETVLLGLSDRAVENPASTMMRAGGITHFCMGWLFLFTSRQLRQPRSLLRLGFWTMVGGLLCLAASSIGTLSHPLLFIAFYGIFLFHEIHDQAALYQVSGDTVATGGNPVFLAAAVRAVTAVLWTLATLGVVLHGLFIRPHPALIGMNPEVLLALGALVLLVDSWLCLHLWKLGVRQYGSWRQALRTHAPLALIYLGMLMMLLLGTLLGGVALNLIILIHGGTWFFFVWHRLCEQPAPPSGKLRLWTWLRSTPRGFVTLHLGLFLVVLTLLALRVHLWNRCGLVSEILAANSFQYWSMMHICMSLWRK